MGTQTVQEFPPVSEVMAEIAAMAAALGVTRINEMEGCWEHQIDDQWWVAVNGHQEDMECSTGGKVPPYGMWFEYNGWPAGLVGASGGWVAAGAAANEDSLIDAIKAATAKAKRTS
jgi:hypothetical protein